MIPLVNDGFFNDVHGVLISLINSSYFLNLMSLLIKRYKTMMQYCN